MPASTVAGAAKDWINPLDKIEQLLTCAICLDRYRTPKLLPCQHTFCMEPCLEGLVDPVRRSLKCPECRAEHPMPYDGVKAFQTNYTLMGFLEIHLESSQDTADELEAYVKRFNMERCRQCNEKAEVDFCAHCEKKICEECKTSHVEMLKRDLTRLMNQVKRISTRISEASNCLKKGIDGLETNVSTVKEEIQDFVKRHIKELAKREDILLTELETFSTAEMRMMRSLRESLEIESNNITEACATIDACVKGEKTLTDDELTRYKRMFTDGLDYLRLFNPDSEDFAIKKVRFVPGQDPQILPHAIAQFGELHVQTTHFNKYQSSETYVPKFGTLGLESDNINFKRRSWDPENPSSLFRREDEGSASERRYGRRNAERYSRPGSAAGSRYADTSPRGSQRGGTMFGNSPWNRANLEGNNTGESENASPVRRSPAPAEEEQPVTVDLPQSKRLAASRLVGSQDDEDLNRRVENIRSKYENRRNQLAEEDTGAGNSPSPGPATSSDRAKPEDEGKAKTKARSSIPRLSVTPKAKTPPNHGTTEEVEDEEIRSGAITPIPVTLFPPSPAEVRSPPPEPKPSHRRNHEVENVDWKKYLIPDDDEPPPSRTPARPTRYMDVADRRRSFVRSRTNPDFHSSSSSNSVEEEPSGAAAYFQRKRFNILRTDSSSTNDLTNLDETQNRYSTPRSIGGTSRYKRKTERSHSSYTGDADDSPRSGRSETARVPTSNFGYDRRADPKVNYLEKGRTLVKFGQKGSLDGQFNWPRGLTVVPVTDEIAICDSSNHRVQIFDHRGVYQKAFGSYGSGKGEFDCLAGICINKYKQFIVSDRYNHRVQIFDSNGRYLREFGSQGQTNGKFNSPWGVAVDNQGFIYVCDKDNHRVQIFQADGNYAGKFGGLGSSEGCFQSPHFVAANKSNQLIVTDCSNHRVQVFDSNGNFQFAFGHEGFGDGQFKYPRGVAVDLQGFILVADSGNNRIQIFYPNGRFYCSFGSWGTGDGQMKQVEGITIAPNGRIVVSDRENHRVQVF